MNRTSTPVFSRVLVALSFLWLLLPGGRTCPAQTGSQHKPEHERLDELVACVVDDMHDWLSKQNVREITVANVQSPPNCASSGVLQSLTDELKLQKVTYKRNARYQLWGQFVSQRTAQPASIQVAAFEFSIRDRDQNSDVVQRLPEHKVVGRAEVEKLLPPPVSAPSPAPATAKKLPGSARVVTVASSPFRIDGTRVFAAGDDRFGIEVLLKTSGGYKPLTPTMEDGVVFADIPLDGVYAVNLINRSHGDAAVDLSIDGISMFQFCKDRKADGKPLYTHYIAPGSQEALLKGWYRDAEGANEFLVKNAKVLPEEMRGLADNQRTGVITAQFCLATPAGVQVASTDRDSLDKRTVIGQSTQQASEVRSWTWDATAPVATIAIRYDKK
jgi:hypothetical protein